MSVDMSLYKGVSNEVLLETLKQLGNPTLILLNQKISEKKIRENM
ncbi:hypothetical protein [Peribacillus loiseleuriae]|nr:hypothetical protein [Peribacillus loiseleuriae]